MNRPVRVVLAFVFLLALLQAAPVASKKNPKSTPEERARAVQLTRELEKDPAVADGPEKRYWLLEFISRVPDISITVCDVLGPAPEEGHPSFPQALGQYMFAMGAFVIEHPDQAKDELAVQAAGIESALKVYEFYVKTNPESRLPFLDDLVKRRDAGTLSDYVKEFTPKCLEAASGKGSPK